MFTIHILLTCIELTMKKLLQTILLIFPCLIVWFLLVMTGLFFQSIASALMISADWIEDKINKE